MKKKKEVKPKQEHVPNGVSPKGPGRPRGKRTDPDFEQVTAYIRKDTHRNVQIALLNEAQRRQFSTLVEDLLSEWLNKRKK